MCKIALFIAAAWLETWLEPMNARAPSAQRSGRSQLTSSTQISLTVVQFAVVIGIVSLAVGGYWWLESSVSTAAIKVDTFSSKLDQAIRTNSDQFKDQDNKREQLGKDFIASNDRIAAKVQELNTAVTVQQHDTKTIADTLAKISEQLNTVQIAPAARRQ
jgi:hypothetical protein